MVEMGSYYSQTEIGKPDSFDFGLELKLAGLLHDEEIAPNPEWLWKKDGYMADVKRQFENLMNCVFAKTVMPSNWKHGGFNEPRYSGFRRNGPACVLHFVHCDPITDAETKIIIQLYILVKVPFSSLWQNHRWPIFLQSQKRLQLNYKLYKYAVMEYFQRHRTEFIHLPIWSGDPPTYPEMVLYAMSMVEQKWLNQFSAMAIPKRIIRICKALTSRFLAAAPKHVKSSLGRSTRKHFDVIHAKMEKCFMFKNGVIGFKRLGDSTEVQNGARPPVLSYSDVELHLDGMRRYDIEKPGSRCFGDLQEGFAIPEFFSPHLFRHIVLTLMSTEKQHGREWTLDDLPRLVVHVFDVIHDHLHDDAFLQTSTCMEYKDKCLTCLVSVLLNSSYYTWGTLREQMYTISEVLREMAHHSSHTTHLFKQRRHGKNCTSMSRGYTRWLFTVYTFYLFFIAFIQLFSQTLMPPKKVKHVNKFDSTDTNSSSDSG